MAFKQLNNIIDNDNLKGRRSQAILSEVPESLAKCL